MRSKFNEKCNLYGTVKDIWSKSWTIPPKNKLKQNKKVKEQTYHDYTQDMFTVKKVNFSK